MPRLYLVVALSNALILFQMLEEFLCPYVLFIRTKVLNIEIKKNAL